MNDRVREFLDRQAEVLAGGRMAAKFSYALAGLHCLLEIASAIRELAEAVRERPASTCCQPTLMNYSARKDSYGAGDPPDEWKAGPQGPDVG